MQGEDIGAGGVCARGLVGLVARGLGQALQTVEHHQAQQGDEVHVTLGEIDAAGGGRKHPLPVAQFRQQVQEDVGHRNAASNRQPAASRGDGEELHPPHEDVDEDEGSHGREGQHGAGAQRAGHGQRSLTRCFALKPARACPHSPQARGGIVGDFTHLRVGRERDKGLRVDERDHGPARCVLAHDHVARQQQSDVGLGAERLVCQGRVAGAEDAIGRMSTPSFSFIAPCMSRSVSTPKPSSFKAAVTSRIAWAKGLFRVA